MKRIKNLNLILIFLCVFLTASAQEVITIAGPNSGINDALIVDDGGNIYGSDFGQSTNGGSSVYKIDTDGGVTTFSTGYHSCNGLAFDNDGRLYVVDYTASASTHQVYQLDENGEKTAYGPTITGASGIIFDPLSDTLYVSQYNGNSNSITKLSPDGTLTLHTNHVLLNGPVGMAFDSAHVLYVANFNDGRIFRITENGDQVVQIADLPNQSFWGVGFLTYADGYLYATGIGTHKIYRVSLDGEVVDFAGVGTPGLVDGPAGEAKFNRPNGIATNNNQDKLFISDLVTYAVREIDLNATTSTIETNQALLESAVISPNPAREFTILEYKLQEGSTVGIELQSADGQIVRPLFKGEKSSGTHRLRIETNGLSAGMYYCKMLVDKKVRVIPLSIQP